MSKLVFELIAAHEKAIATGVNASVINPETMEQTPIAEALNDYEGMSPFQLAVEAIDTICDLAYECTKLRDQPALLDAKLNALENLAEKLRPVVVNIDGLCEQWESALPKEDDA